MKMNTRGERSRTMNSDLTFITPNSRAELATGQANEKSIRHAGGVLVKRA